MIKPMRGVKLERDLDGRTYYASPKIDGLRCIVKDGKVLSKTLKLIPNRYVQELFSHLEGADGELVVGVPYATPEDGPAGVFGRSRGHLMRKSSDPIDVTFCVFDRWDRPDEPFSVRINQIAAIEQRFKEGLRSTPGGLWVVEHAVLKHDWQLDRLLEAILTRGYEGVMLRRDDALYKYGQSTLNEGALIKVKPLETSEALILGVVEQQENTNEAFKDELGRTKRSSAKEGKVGKGTFGSFLLRDVHSGVEFSCGTGEGLTDELRRVFWDNRNALPGQYVEYQFQKIGSDVAPRQPIFLKLRPSLDVSESESL